MKTENWQTIMKELKLQHIEKTAPGFYDASGGSSMSIKPFSEKTDSKLAAAIAACFLYSGGTAEVQYNFKILNGINGFKPVFEDFWKPIRVNATFENKTVTVVINKRGSNAAKSSAKELILTTNNFQTFGSWFASHFPLTEFAIAWRSKNTVAPKVGSATTGEQRIKGNKNSLTEQPLGV